MVATNDQIPDFDDFERYCSGKMPSDEQRSLEGRMLAEPLVAEAYEGFLVWRAQNTGIASVRADLQERLHARVTHEPRKILPLWAYASAASVLLAMVSYWTVYLRDPKAVPQESAVVLKQQGAKLSIPEQASVPAVSPEKISSKPFADDPKASGPAGPVPAKQPGQGEPKFETALAPEVLADEEVREESINATFPDLTQAEKEAAKALPNPSGALVAPNPGQAAGKSVAGRVRMEPSSLYSVASDAAVAAREETARKKAAMPLAVLPDTLVAGPAQGWAVYGAYLNKSTDSASTAGDVVVTFIVGPQGALSGFKAKGPDELHKEAIRIVREGPAWVPARTKSVPVASMAQIQLQFRQGQ